MPPYDSDSSSEDEDYTETNVLLGYASKEPTSDTTSHLGGHPAWLDEKTTPNGAYAKCKTCNNTLTLLLELNGDLPEHFPGHERRLYLFACRRKACRRKDGSVRGIRGVRIAQGAYKLQASSAQEKAEAEEEKKPQLQLGESLFGVKNGAAPANPFSNPFSTNANGKAPANPFSSASKANPFSSATASDDSSTPSKDVDASLPQTFADKVRLSSPPASSTAAPRPHEPWPSEDKFPPPYPSYHLDADYETLDAPSTPQIPDTTPMDIDGGEASGSGGGKEDKEAFESTLDKTFQKFADRVGQNSEQVLRYEFKGKPLLYSDADAVGKLLAPHSEHGSANAKVTTAGGRGGSGMPRCTTCGAERVFELQLTPHAITELEAEELGIEGMEWGTIILGVCANDCKPADVAEGEVGYVEEWVGVQWEELVKKK